MVGLAFAMALRHVSASTEVTVLEARVPPSGTPSPLDSRASALNLVSRDILSVWGVWPAIIEQAGVIQQIHVSNQHRFGSSVLEPSDVGSDDGSLGFVIENHYLGRALLSRAQELGVVLAAPVDVRAVQRGDLSPGVVLASGETLSADLVVIADGSQSSLRQQLGIPIDTRSPGQRAVVANVLFDAEQRGIAWERFTPHGPLALLPLPGGSGSKGSRFNVVWSMPKDAALALEATDAPHFCEALQDAVGWRLGKVLDVGTRTGWTLDRVLAQEQSRPGFLLAGNAAHGLHPVAGQGLNLSLRDAWQLATSWGATTMQAEPDFIAAMINRFVGAVREDQDRTVSATDMLSTLFAQRGLLLDLPRDLALAGLDTMSPLRRYIARRGTGVGSQLPAGRQSS